MKANLIFVGSEEKIFFSHGRSLLRDKLCRLIDDCPHIGRRHNHANIATCCAAHLVGEMVKRKNALLEENGTKEAVKYRRKLANLEWKQKAVKRCSSE